ncbi:uncharacterized protein LOC126268157 [Schistocerca gregaria]|uniref:uncharacterized protein LOC126268157 n=1 Tax=Schistocerca gregaria TaxID=7010 RepID=UPI00211E5153|nr:uncharacterized protein LOC126268157 [Schistocerca gregaria]
MDGAGLEKKPHISEETAFQVQFETQGGEYVHAEVNHAELDKESTSVTGETEYPRLVDASSGHIFPVTLTIVAANNNPGKKCIILIFIFLRLTIVVYRESAEICGNCIVFRVL